MNAAWEMNEDGEFILQEPYATMLNEAKLIAAKAWRDALIGYLEPRCRYTGEELNRWLLKLTADGERTPMETVDDLVVRALEGDL